MPPRVTKIRARKPDPESCSARIPFPLAAPHCFSDNYRKNSEIIGSIIPLLVKLWLIPAEGTISASEEPTRDSVPYPKGECGAELRRAN